LTHNEIRLLFAKDNLSFMSASRSGKPGFWKPSDMKIRKFCTRVL